MAQHTLTERQHRALQMRKAGKKLREIGDALSISPARARELVEHAQQFEQHAAWAEGLPPRYVRTLLSRGIDSVSQLRHAIESGMLRRMPGIGPKCYETIAEWMKRK